MGNIQNMECAKLRFHILYISSSYVEHSGSVGTVLNWGLKGCLFKSHRWWRHCVVSLSKTLYEGAQWLSVRVLDSRPRGRGFEPHRHHCVVSLSKNINPSLVLVQPRKTCPFITDRLLMGRKELNQTNKTLYALLNAGSTKEDPT